MGALSHSSTPGPLPTIIAFGESGGVPKEGGAAALASEGRTVLAHFAVGTLRGSKEIPLLRARANAFYRGLEGDPRHVAQALQGCQPGIASALRSLRPGLMVPGGTERSRTQAP